MNATTSKNAPMCRYMTRFACHGTIFSEEIIREAPSRTVVCWPNGSYAVQFGVQSFAMVGGELLLGQIQWEPGFFYRMTPDIRVMTVTTVLREQPKSVLADNMVTNGIDRVVCTGGRYFPLGKHDTVEGYL